MVFVGNLRKMKLPSSCSTLLPDLPRRRLYFCKLLSAAAFVCILFFIGSSFVNFGYKEKVSKWEPTMGILQNIIHSSCEIQGKPSGSEPLPKGIIRRTSNLEMQPLWGSLPSPKQKGHKSPSKSLLAIAVGVKQKEVVNQIVKKFSSSDFIVMLFHYDGIVNKWRDLSWSDKALHISAMNQTKWWFAKRFLHPDIVAEYDYIFLWDEDLNVEHFNPSRYLSIVRREGLDISQPGLDTSKSNVHHRITARARKGDVHRRIYKLSGGGRCYENSTGPPCTGWVEMMAPVFSRAAWRCAWHLIQNDLIHAWGLDMKLGYCVQGDRSKKVGVVDSEYIGHLGLPTLGGLNESKSTETSSVYSQSKASRARKISSGSPPDKDRLAVRKRSYVELEIFKERWQRAVADDKCWIDPYPVPEKEADR
ncbi:uncharacterized protein LOC109825922 isoform X2 [Asparagus officinalis]|uniref:uncharacterized protein LOC109825922 isoform X2 n=1 Tax=Asparagus officinalis TaxID=4686 RepID=UPI00098E23E4|nr:uncharacterized protein LOC109825922 isoform X2 [Asparagus officinalis]